MVPARRVAGAVSKVTEVAADKALFRFLPGAEFADAFALESPQLPKDARVVASHVLGNRPSWVSLLMAIRNAAVRPFGLKAPEMDRISESMIGVFPVIEASGKLVVMGFDDTHLDFRVIVTITEGDDRHNQAILTTLVRTKSLAGRAYLTVIKPAHRRIVRALLAQQFPKRDRQV